MNRKNSIPSLMTASRAAVTSAEEWNNQLKGVGARAPKTVGPRIIPPIISPNTAGCPILRAICPHSMAQASMAAICSANNTKLDEFMLAVYASGMIQTVVDQANHSGVFEVRRDPAGFCAFLLDFSEDGQGRAVRRSGLEPQSLTLQSARNPSKELRALLICYLRLQLAICATAPPQIPPSPCAGRPGRQPRPRSARAARRQPRISPAPCR